MPQDIPAEGILGYKNSSNGICFPSAALYSLELGAVGIQLIAGELTHRGQARAWRPTDLASAMSSATARCSGAQVSFLLLWGGIWPFSSLPPGPNSNSSPVC